MQDAIIKGTGDSRYLRTVPEIKELCPDYDAFLARLVEGSFPVDLAGINTGGWEQQGTALSKANLLTDSTAARMNLGNEATVNGMLSALADAVIVAQAWANTAHLVGQAARKEAAAAQATADEALAAAQK